MMPRTVLRSSLDDVLDAVKAELVLRLSIEASRVHKLARHQDKAPALDAPQDILLRVRGFAAGAGAAVCGGDGFAVGVAGLAVCGEAGVDVCAPPAVNATANDARVIHPTISRLLTITS